MVVSWSVLFISMCYLFPLTLDSSGMEDPVELSQLQDDVGLIILLL
jgi:hypothetical protein